MIIQAFLTSEIALAKGIFLEYTNLYLNACALSFANEERIWQGCVELDAALKVLQSVESVNDVWYSKGAVITEEYLMQIIYLIHEYHGAGISNDVLRMYTPSQSSSSSSSSTAVTIAGIREGRHDNMPAGTYRIPFSSAFDDNGYNNHVQIVQDGMDVFNGYIKPTSDAADLAGFEVTVPAGGLATIYYTAIKFQ